MTAARPAAPRLPADPDFTGVTCPHCGCAEAAVVSLFGATASEVLLQCGHCRTCFNWIKWRHQLPPVPARRGGRRH